MRLEKLASVAVVGASPNSFYTARLLENLERYGFKGETFPVNPRYSSVRGLKCYPSVDSLPQGPDFGVVAVNAGRCLTQVAALREIGCRFVVVLSDGFAETGISSGVEAQARLASYCKKMGMTLVGPNCLGIADFWAGTVALAAPIPPGLTAGGVSVISQSGALLVSMLIGLGQESLGVDLAVSVGNSAGLDFVGALEACLDRAQTQTICGYMEGYGGDLSRLERALVRADDSGKQVVLVRAGSTETAQRIAMSHTASVSGPEHLMRALLSRYGAVRVASVDEMVRTVALSSYAGRKPGRLFVIASTGGGAGLASDLAASAGVRLAELSDPGVRRLEALLPPSAFAGNPMDMSGQVAGGSMGIGDVYDVIFSEPTVGPVMFVAAAGFPDGSPARQMHREQLEGLAQTAEEYGRTLIVASVARQGRTVWVQELVERFEGVVAVDGLSTTMTALGNLQQVTATVVRPSRVGPRDLHHPAPSENPPLSEADGRAILELAGLAVVPGVIYRDMDDLRCGVDSLNFPLVAKAILPGVSHKSAFGAVALGLCDSTAVVEACSEMQRRLRADSRVTSFEGFLLEEMVSGIELLLGLQRHPDFGPALTVGLGGVLAETVKHHATALLPLPDDQYVDELFRSAGLGDLLATLNRESSQKLMKVVASAASSFVDGVLSEYSTVEVNPLFITQVGTVLAGDVLIW